MNRNDYNIRLEKEEDYRDVEALVRERSGMSTVRDAVSIM